MGCGQTKEIKDAIVPVEGAEIKAGEVKTPSKEEIKKTTEERKTEQAEAIHIPMKMSRVELQLNNAARDLLSAMQQGEKEMARAALSVIETIDFASCAESIENPIEAVNYFVSALSHRNAQGCNFALLEKMTRPVPALLDLLLLNRQAAQEGLAAEDLRVLKDGVDKACPLVNERMWCGPEIKYHLDTAKKILLLINDQDSLWSEAAKSAGRFGISVWKFLASGGEELEALEQLKNLFMKAVEKIQKERYARHTLFPLRHIQALACTVLKKARDGKKSDEEFKKIDLLLQKYDNDIKQGYIQILEKLCEEQTLRETAVNILKGFVEDKNEKIRCRCMAARILVLTQFEGREEFLTNVARQIRDSKQEKLLKQLCTKPDELKKMLDGMEDQWESLRGVDYGVYEQMRVWYEKQIEKQKNYYVPLFAKLKNEDEKLYIDNKVETFLRDKNKRIMLLLGNSGSGKTLYMKKLTHDMLDRQTKYLPIYVYLAKLRKKLDEVIEHGLKQYAVKSDNPVIRDKHLLFLLDGWDELYNKKANLFKKNDFFQLYHKCKVIVTSRRQEVYQITNYEKKFSFEEHVPEEVILQGFSKDQLQEYFARALEQNRRDKDLGKANFVDMGWESAEEAIQTIAKVRGLYDLLTNPFIAWVSIVLTKLIKKHAGLDKPLSKYELYENFLREIHKKGYKRREKPGEEDEFDQHQAIRDMEQMTTEAAFFLLSQKSVRGASLPLEIQQFQKRRQIGDLTIEEETLISNI